MTRTQANLKKRRRQIEVRIKLAMIILMFIVVISGAVVIGTVISNANEAQDNSFKYFKSIEVDAGDTLWSIADEYMDSHYDSKNEYIKEVMKINSLTSDQIAVGQFIVVPYYGELDLSLNWTIWEALCFKSSSIAA